MARKAPVSVEDTVRLVLHSLCWKPVADPIDATIRIHRRAIVVREIDLAVAVVLVLGHDHMASIVVVLGDIKHGVTYSN